MPEQTHFDEYADQAAFDRFAARHKAIFEKADKAVAKDAGKPRLSLVPGLWIRFLVEPFQAGIDKGYDEGNWKLSINTDEHDTFRNRRLESFLRHSSDIQDGILVDDETGVSSFLLAAWNALLVHTYDHLKQKGGTL